MLFQAFHGKTCNKCPSEQCLRGFRGHSWRANCLDCHCRYFEHHDVKPDIPEYLVEMQVEDKFLDQVQDAKNIAKKLNFHWLPVGLREDWLEEYLENFLKEGLLTPDHGDFPLKRSKEISMQIPFYDRKPANNISKEGRPIEDHNLEAEQREATRFLNSRNKRDFGVGSIDRTETSFHCQKCNLPVESGALCVRVRPDHKTCQNLAESDVSMSNPKTPVWHINCFCCEKCSNPLVDWIYCWSNGKPYCIRHYGEIVRPRCVECDHLIFSEEFTRAMDQDHHSGHFACKSCDQSLTGQRYILREDEPHCLNCYEQKFANTCEQCKKKIGCDSKDLSFKERHWHEACFKCSACETSLADRPFATKEEVLFCSDCYDEKFAARCDGCQKVFKAGMRKYEYREQQWHEECFVCSECKNPIGAKSFIPRENQVVCVPCYEEKYAQKCTKCGKVIRRGGVTYKGNPWHKECFCCSSCNKELAGLKFTSKDDQPYCAECYGELFAKKCFKCKLPITGFGGCKFISFEERHWHSECFSCNKCDSNLVGRGFLTSEDLILCSECGR